jgi:GSCFA family.
MGSCFAENMGERLRKYGFDSDVNPFGILYNPLSIASSLERLMSGSPFTEAELFQYNGLWHSYAHHGNFSAVTAGETLEKINERLMTAAVRLSDYGVLLVTFGTAWVYRKRDDDRIVANCHKVPERNFTRSRLSVEDITSLWIPLLQKLKQHNPDLRVLFTVSPIRHWKDGAHENQLSKATLLLAIEQLRERCSVDYFPAYELMMDELRDYRFYAADMLHPSELAIDYIWDRFVASCFDKTTRETMREVEQINRAMSHRPLNPDSEEYLRFRKQTLLRRADLLQRFPHLLLD